jgi:two-component system chemotaxis response regulator CheY
MRCLIVEDDTTSRLLLVELLSKYGAVQAFDSGPPALTAINESLVSKEPFDLICLDIMLPDMDGLQILRKVRTLEDQAGYPIGRGSKVVMTTALRDKANIMSAFRGACDGYLTKPIGRAKLVERLRELELLPK